MSREALTLCCAQPRCLETKCLEITIQIHTRKERAHLSPWADAMKPNSCRPLISRRRWTAPHFVRGRVELWQRLPSRLHAKGNRTCIHSSSSSQFIATEVNTEHPCDGEQKGVIYTRTNIHVGKYAKKLARCCVTQARWNCSAALTD